MAFYNTSDSLDSTSNDIIKPIDEETVVDNRSTTGYDNELFFLPEMDYEKVFEDDVPILDSFWVSNSFMIKAEDLDEDYKFNRFSTLVSEKFVDTSIGGNISINTSPQFTRYADIRLDGKVNGRNRVEVMSLKGNHGMGRYYGEAIDDNSTNIYFEFGVPKFNNTLFYLLSSVDYKTAVIANSGRSTVFYDFGKAIGIGAVVLAFPVIGPALLIAKYVTGVVSDLAMSPGRFDHYYLKPTMFTYWSTVNSLVTMMSTELGILSPYFMDDNPSRIGSPITIKQIDIDRIKKLMPGFITDGNAVNVHAMVSRTQIMYAKQQKMKLEALQSITDSSFIDGKLSRVELPKIDEVNLDGEDTLWKKLKTPISKDKNFEFTEKPADITNVLNKLAEEHYVTSNDNNSTKDLKSIYNADGKGTIERKGRVEDEKTWISSAKETAATVFNEGARYAVFRVEHIGSTSATFSSSTTTTGLDDKVNSMGKTWRDIKFNMGGGEIPGLSTVTKAATDLLVGVLDGVTFGISNVVAGFLAGSNLNADKRWDSSSANLPTVTYKMQLRSPSAHPVAQLQNLYIPLASILAGALPLSTGMRSYTSPFLCSLFVRGHQHINRGMITSVTVTKGVGNLAYNKQRRTLALDIKFTVTDFSQIVAAPVVSDLLSSGSVMFDDESGISRYIQSLCSRDLYSTNHVSDRIKIKASAYFQNHSIMMSSEYWGAMIGDTVGTGIFSVFGKKAVVNYSELY